MVALDPSEARAFIQLAFDRMMSKAVALGDRVSDRPDLDGANSVFALVRHCVGVADWWLDHAVLGNPSERDRSAEFEAAGSLAELEALVEGFSARLQSLLNQVAATPEPAARYLESATASSRAWPWTTSAIVLHVVEELFQHAGHVDVTADLLEPTHQVVAAVLVRDNQVLLCHRHPDRQWYRNVWDVPGGHVDRGEKRTDALVRELHEELGVVVDPVDAISIMRHTPNPDLDIEIWVIAAWVGRHRQRCS